MEVQTEMATIKEDAMAYEPQQTKNIADLESVSTEIETSQKDYKDSEGKPFTVGVVTIDGEDYRVPVSVLKSLKAQLNVRPDLKKFRVIKSGEGFNTEYTVIPLI